MTQLQVLLHYSSRFADKSNSRVEVNVTEWPQNIHEYHRMIATAQANAMKLEELQKKAAAEPEAKPEAKEEEK